MKNLLLALIITLIVVVGGYLLYALFWEGTFKLENVVPDKKNDSIIESAQKLLIGDYIVYATWQSTPDRINKIKLWRYLVGSQGTEEITSFLTDSQDIEFFKFSEQSLAVWQGNNKELWHINGDLIGPAEDSRALISPDRRWLIKADSKTIELQSISTGASKQWDVEDYISAGVLSPKQWSADSRLVYLVAQSEAGKIQPGLWVLDLSVEQIVEYSLVAEKKIGDITVYPERGQAIGATLGLPGRIMLIDLKTGVTKELISNSKFILANPKLSATGNFFSYNLLDGKESVWLSDFINPQKKQEELVEMGELLAWPQDNIFLINDNDVMKIYNRQTGNTVKLTSDVGADWDFIDIFNIKK